MDDTPRSDITDTEETPDKISLSKMGDVVLVLQDKRELAVLSHLLTHASTTFKALLGPHFAESQQERSAKQPLRLSLPDDDSGDKSELKVSSHCLSQVSTTFRALLGSRFAEGQQHRSAEFPQHIHLPDDDPTAMLHLCSILQYMPLDEAMRSKHDAPTVKRILQFAATADKYDCAAAVELTITGLLARFMQPSGTLSLCLPHLSDLALAAHLLRLPRHFTIFTSRIVTEHTDPFSTLLSEGIAEHPGAGAICEPNMNGLVLAIR
nr:hypothetical protein B0A51_05086 [Rachicladosporium sp. CCFEE 5018]